MKKINNKPADFVPEMLDRLIKAHPDQLAYAEDIHSIVRADAPVEGKLALAPAAAPVTCRCFWDMLAKACSMAAP